MTLLESLTFTFGKEAQLVGGRPYTFVTADMDPSATLMYVLTTLGCPPSGVIWANGREFKYTSKTHNTFQGITAWRALTIPHGTRVTLSTRRVLPDSYELFWPSSPHAASFYGTDQQAALDYL